MWASIPGAVSAAVVIIALLCTRPLCAQESPTGATQRADSEALQTPEARLQEGAPPPPELPVQSATAVLVETEAQGVDPVVGRFVGTRLVAELEALGYSVVSTREARDRMVEMGLAYPPTVADLWRVTYRTQAERGVFAQVWAENGKYVVRLYVATHNGSGPYFAHGETDNEGMGELVARLVSEALPAPGQGLPEVDRAQQLARDARDGIKFFDTGLKPRRRIRFRPMRIAVNAEPAFGFTEDGFFNQLLGLRLDYRFSRDLALGAYVAYANLRGRNGRVSSVVTSLQIDNRVSVVRGSRVQIPLRGAIGYLWRNGVVLRLATGVAIPLGRRTELVLDLVAPTFWLTPEHTLFSLSLGADLGWKF